jgi:hypothetical protein
MSRVRRLQVLESRPHLVLPTRRDPEGLTGPTPNETRGPHWRSTSWGFYVQSEVEATTEQRIVEAATVCPPHGGVTGWAGLHWEHARWFPGTMADGTPLPVCLAVGGEDVRGQSGIDVSAERLDPRDLIVVDEVPITTAVRSVCFEMRYAADVRAAARALSMAAYSDLVSLAELADYASRHSGWTGIPQCRLAIPLAEENCWSPPELDSVLVWRLDAGLPRPWCNRPLFRRDDGRHIGTPDFIDVESGLLVQYDGELHLASAQRSRDVRLEDDYRAAGLECLTVMKSDLRSPAALAERMLAARGRARWEAESRRAWTVEYPSWWTPTHTVDLRRVLTESERRRVLRYRSA